MKHATFDTLLALIDDVARAFAKLARRAAHTIAGMSWPALALACVGLALALTVVPLALFLFLVFMAVKLIVAALVVNTRRGKATPYREHDPKHEPDNAPPHEASRNGDGGN